uniref:TIR domain-containing protein n=1 Tax=Candidatus Kentrum sp. FW TaxID=2126338 RepID=A0A450SN55_9GAMM|nr:MAG: TIR domain-containing protein [Candidatus Kentron sp. FW]
MHMTYDVFLSHRSENKPWVEILARNLVACGQRVFLDSWEIVPGRSIPAQLDAALENSRAGVLVATPESLESGWVREEYDRMLKMQVNGNLTLLPLIFGAIPGFPFLDSRLCIDFGDPTPDYLATIARQLGLPQGIGDGFALETALEEQLRSHPLFLLITRLHSGSAAGRQLLAGMLRSLGERHDDLHLVLCGSEKLAALKFADGKLSLFTNADALYWPEPQVDDILSGQDRTSPTREEAEHLLAITGGHPQLLQKCLHHRGRTDCKKLVRRDPDLAALFARYRENRSGDADRLREWLGRERIGPYRFWPADGLLRGLYWDNLLVERDDQFAWRCPAIREAFLADLDA